MSRFFFFSSRRLMLMLLCCGVAVVYLLFDPSRVGWFPRCPFRMLTGWLCPGCGSQRAFHQLLHGDVSAAFCYNAALVAGIPVVSLLLLVEWQRIRWPRLHARLYSPGAIWSLFVIIVAWWIGRNVV